MLQGINGNMFDCQLNLIELCFILFWKILDMNWDLVDLYNNTENKTVIHIIVMVTTI